MINPNDCYEDVFSKEELERGFHLLGEVVEYEDIEEIELLLSETN